ncbi:XdhC family protein, partial [Mesorhizobium sp. M4B.F.Ca.ET.211.01.1.1]
MSAAPGFLAEGSPRGVLETALTRVRAGEHAVFALVLETDGSTYAGAGDMVLFCNGSQVGWLSGGCLEPELARRAEQVSAAGQVDWIEIDTRSDDDLLSGSAL